MMNVSGSENKAENWEGKTKRGWGHDVLCESGFIDELSLSVKS